MSKKTEAWKVARVLKLVADGVPQTEIVETLNISRETVLTITRQAQNGGRRTA